MSSVRTFLGGTGAWTRSSAMRRSRISHYLAARLAHGAHVVNGQSKNVESDAYCGAKRAIFSTYGVEPCSGNEHFVLGWQRAAQAEVESDCLDDRREGNRRRRHARRAVRRLAGNDPA